MGNSSSQSSLIITERKEPISSSPISQRKDSIHGSSLPFTISNRDERTEVTTTKEEPYNYICWLEIETAQEKIYYASGFKISITSPFLQHQVILTSGHSLFVGGSFVKKVTVTFPGQPSVCVQAENLWVPTEFKETSHPDYNIGTITLAGNSESGFQWTTMLTDSELQGRPLSCCGHPADKPVGSMWMSGGGVETVTNNTIHYMYNSTSLSSGGAVYTWHKGHWTVVGVHGYSHDDVNVAVRLSSEIMYKVLKAVGFQMQYRVQSKQFPRIYLCTDTMLDLDKEVELLSISHYSAGKMELQEGVFDIIPLTSSALYENGYYHVCVSPSASSPKAFMMLTRESDHSVSVTNKLVQLRLHNHEDSSVGIESVNQPGLYLSLREMQEQSTSDPSAKCENANESHKYALTCQSVLRAGINEKFLLHSV